MERTACNQRQAVPKRGLSLFVIRLKSRPASKAE